MPTYKMPQPKMAPPAVVSSFKRLKPGRVPGNALLGVEMKPLAVAQVSQVQRSGGDVDGRGRMDCSIRGHRCVSVIINYRLCTGHSTIHYLGQINTEETEQCRSRAPESAMFR